MVEALALDSVIGYTTDDKFLTQYKSGRDGSEPPRM